MSKVLQWESKEGNSCSESSGCNSSQSSTSSYIFCTCFISSLSITAEQISRNNGAGWTWSTRSHTICWRQCKSASSCQFTTRKGSSHIWSSDQDSCECGADIAKDSSLCIETISAKESSTAISLQASNQAWQSTACKFSRNRPATECAGWSVCISAASTNWESLRIADNNSVAAEG